MKFTPTRARALASTLILSGAGCSAAPDLESEATGVVQQDVTGGTTSTTPLPGDPTWPSTVRISQAFNSSAGFPADRGARAVCTGIKIAGQPNQPINRFLTAAHCVDDWFGQGRVLITNDPTQAPTELANLGTVTKVYAHPSWAMKSGNFAYIGRPYDVAMFDVQEASPSIPAYSFANAPKVNNLQIENGVNTRLVGYGGLVKAWGDNTTVPPGPGSGSNFDIGALPFTSIFFSGTPTGEAGDSGAAVFQLYPSGWWIGGIVSGPSVDLSQTRMTRVSPILNWILNPSQPTLANNSGGYLINAHAPACMEASPAGFAGQFACYAGALTNGLQYWSLQSTSVAGRFRIKNGQTGKCLGVSDNSNAAQTPNSTVGRILQQTCDTANTNLFQQWDFVSRGNLDQSGGAGNNAPGFSFYQLRNAGGPIQRCIAPFSGSDAQGQLYYQYTCVTPPANPSAAATGNEQVWAFTR